MSMFTRFRAVHPDLFHNLAMILEDLALATGVSPVTKEVIGVTAEMLRTVVLHDTVETGDFVQAKTAEPAPAFDIATAPATAPVAPAAIVEAVHPATGSTTVAP